MMSKEHVNENLVRIVEEIDKPISKMTVAELKEYAHVNGIDLKGATKKDDILNMLGGEE